MRQWGVPNSTDPFVEAKMRQEQSANNNTSNNTDQTAIPWPSAQPVKTLRQPRSNPRGNLLGGGRNPFLSPERTRSGSPRSRAARPENGGLPPSSIAPTAPGSSTICFPSSSSGDGGPAGDKDKREQQKPKHHQGQARVQQSFRDRLFDGPSSTHKTAAELVAENRAIAVAEQKKQKEQERQEKISTKPFFKTLHTAFADGGESAREGLLTTPLPERYRLQQQKQKLAEEAAKQKSILGKRARQPDPEPVPEEQREKEGHEEEEDPETVIQELQGKSTPSILSMPHQFTSGTKPVLIISLLFSESESYFRCATDIHEFASTGLDIRHNNLLGLLEDIAEDDEEFLRTAQRSAKLLTTPLSKFAIRTQHRAPDGTQRVEKKTFGEISKETEGAVQKIEKEITQLWKEWVVAEKEVQKCLSKEFNGGGGQEQSAAATSTAKGKKDKKNNSITTSKSQNADIAEFRVRFQDAIEKETKQADKEIDKLTQKAFHKMKEIDKVSTTGPPLLSDCRRGRKLCTDKNVQFPELPSQDCPRVTQILQYCGNLKASCWMIHAIRLVVKLNRYVY